MKKTDTTTPLINLLFQDALRERSDQYVKETLKISFARGNLSSIKYHQEVLGKQKYCETYSDRCWIWEGDNWRLYVSKRGPSFEVLENLTLDEAWLAWQDYYGKMNENKI